jgi:hypothetical protein
LVLNAFKSTANNRWALFCSYAVSVIAGCSLGLVGPWVTNGAWWNFSCVNQAVDSNLGLYKVHNHCGFNNWMQVIEVAVRLPFQIIVIGALHKYYVALSQR